MEFRERKQVAIFVTAGVIAAGFVLFRYLPLRTERKAVEQERAAQMLSVSKAAAERQNIPVLAEQLRQLQVAIGNYEASIPAERALGEFLQGIASLMSKHDLREQLIQPGREVEADGLYCIPVNMQCKGSLGQIFEFYESLQRMDRLVRIEKVTLVNDSDLAGEVRMETSSVVYYRGQGSQG